MAWQAECMPCTCTTVHGMVEHGNGMARLAMAEHGMPGHGLATSYGYNRHDMAWYGMSRLAMHGMGMGML